MRRDKGGSVALKCVDKRSFLERSCQSADREPVLTALEAGQILVLSAIFYEVDGAVLSWQDGKAEGLHRLEVDHQLEFGRLLDRQIGGLRALPQARASK